MTIKLDPAKAEEIALNQLFERDREARAKMEKDLNAAHDRIRQMQTNYDRQVAELNAKLKDSFGSKTWLKATAGVVAWEIFKAAGPWIVHRFF